MFKNRVTSKIFGTQLQEVAGGWKNCTVRSFLNFTSR